MPENVDKPHLLYFQGSWWVRHRTEMREFDSFADAAAAARHGLTVLDGHAR